MGDVIKDRMVNLMLRAGIRNPAALIRACERIEPPKVGSRKYADAVGRNLIQGLWQGRAKGLSFKQVDVLCEALKCTPDELFGHKPIEEMAPAAERVEKMEKRFNSLLQTLAESKDPKLVDTIRKIREETEP